MFTPNPKVQVGFGRAVANGYVFSEANPAEAPRRHPYKLGRNGNLDFAEDGRRARQIRR